MARIAGADLPREKRVENSLTYISVLVAKTANDILKSSGVNLDTRVERSDGDEGFSRCVNTSDKHLVVEWRPETLETRPEHQEIGRRLVATAASATEEASP